MIIGYRRVAGRLPLTNDEAGQRGTWLEKRHALIGELTLRGHSFKWLSRPTDNSLAAGHTLATDTECDVLMLEFGGMNLSFFRKDWDRTIELIKSHPGRIIFITDDPDLTFVWNELPDEDYSRWTVAVNAVNLDECREVLKVPEAAAVVDWPFHLGMIPRDFVDGELKEAVYYGRPNGRSKLLAPYVTSGAIVVAGREKEWGASVSLIAPPEQKDRQEFYRHFRACLAVYDNKHLLTGWRTGRAYHALLAGIPVAAPAGNRGLAWAWELNGLYDLAALLRMPARSREMVWEQQLEAAYTTSFDFKDLGL